MTLKGPTHTPTNTPQIGTNMRYAVIISDQWLHDGTTLFHGDKDEVVEWLALQTNVKNYEILPDGSVVRLTVPEFLTNIVNIVPKFRQMDPETEDLLPGGNYLANGMRVLFANPDERGRPEDLEDWARDRALERNRWCTVTNLKIKGHSVKFVAVYDDGTKRVRSTAIQDSWLVKKDSIEESQNLAAGLRNKVYEIVEEAMIAAAGGASGEGTPDEKAARAQDKADEATARILDLF